MNAELESLALRILSAVFNGGYQGLLLTLLVWLGLSLFPRTNAATRHAVGFATLLVVAILPAIHFFAPKTGRHGLHVPMWAGRGPSVDEGKVRIQSQLIPASQLVGKASDASATLPSRTRSDLVSASRISTVHRPAMDERVAMEAARERRSAFVPAFDPIPPTRVDQSPRPLMEKAVAPAEHASSGFLWRASLPARLAVGLMGLWAAITSIRSAKLLAECRYLHRLKRRGIRPSGGLRDAFVAVRRAMRVRRKADLLIVPGPAAPMAVGFLKPAVLIPENLLEGRAGAALDQILRHELAHLSRKDDWSNLVQQLVKTALFFHPAIWWLSRRLTLDREIACDDHVLAATSTPRAYALFLTEVAGLVQYRSCSAAPAGWGRKSQLKERIHMILDPKRNSSTKLAKARAGILTTAAALLAVLSLHAAPRLALAQSKAGDTDSPTPSAKSIEPTAQSTATISVLPLALPVKTESAVRSTESIAGASAFNGRIVNSTPRVTTHIAVTPEVQVAFSDATSAPRLKPGRTSTASAMPEPPNLSDIPAPPSPPQAPSPATLPPQAGMLMPRPASGRADNSLEERIERLERLIDSMLDDKASDDGRKFKMKDEYSESKPGAYWNSHSDKLEPSGEEHDFAKIDRAEIAEITKRAKLEAERATRDAMRQAEQAKRSLMRSMRMEDRNMRNAQPGQELEARRQVLESEQHALQEQLKHLEEQINQLEQQRDQIEARVDHQQDMLEELNEQSENEVEQQHEQNEREEANSDASDSKAPTTGAPLNKPSR